MNLNDTQFQELFKTIPEISTSQNFNFEVIKKIELIQERRQLIKNYFFTSLTLIGLIFLFLTVDINTYKRVFEMYLNSLSDIKNLNLTKPSLLYPLLSVVVVGIGIPLFLYYQKVINYLKAIIPF